MQEIKCPKCGEVFKVDESDYAQIVQQVRDREFAAELERRRAELEEKKNGELKIIEMKQENRLREELSKRDAELSDKDRLIQELKSSIDSSDTEKQLAVSEAVQKKEKELSEKDRQIQELQSQLDSSETRTRLAVSEAVREKDREISEKEQQTARALSEKEQQIQSLRSRVESGDTEKQLAVSEAVREKDREISEKETEIADLKGQLLNRETESRLKEQTMKETFAAEMRAKDEQIEFYRDFKARQSTKMIGESLEQHCLAQFNQIRSLVFPGAYFEKDNDAKTTGSKGDFIFRENAPDGEELISIMFEMKNEADNTAAKHKNEDFFKELDKDRNEKNCEYAVLVSMLETDSELYNAGIVDVSYRYEKMYVIRPQFFIPIITLLRNGAMSSLRYRQELRDIQERQLDIVSFENNMNAFKEAFGKNYNLAGTHFRNAIEKIDGTIKMLEKTKSELELSIKQLNWANDKAEKLSIKTLARNSPSIMEQYTEQKNSLPADGE